MDKKTESEDFKKLPVKEIRNQVSKQHADLVSLYQDLKYVAWATNQAIRVLEEKEDDVDNLQLTTLWAATLIAYRRCFNSGKRKGLSKSVYKDLPGDAIGAHDYYYEQANKLVAHSVNPFEEVKVGVVVNGDAIIGVSELSAKLASTSKDGYITLHGLAMHSLRFLEEKIEDSRKEVEYSAKKLGAHNISKLNEIKYIVPGPQDASSARD